jgi:hypothetical protein
MSNACKDSNKQMTQAGYGAVLLHRVLDPAGEAGVPGVPEQRGLPTRHLPGPPTLLCCPHTARHR